MHVWGQFIWHGTGRTSGTGDYSISLPASADVTLSAKRVGMIDFYEAGLGRVATNIKAYQASATTINGYYSSSAPYGNIGIWGSGAPISLGGTDGDEIDFYFIIELA